jgi:HAE1 family hydrophobic/amphiphilic exporter-1
MLLIYLILAAKYSWLNPFAVILVVPLAVLGTIAAAQ